MIEIKEKWDQLLIKQPNLRIRNAAAQLGVSELELLHSKINEGAIKLDLNLKSMLPEIERFGEVMALSRNNDAVHERIGIYSNAYFEGSVGLVVNPDIDLRIFSMHWKYAYAVEEKGRRSIQFFDKSGEATHKIYQLEKSNQKEWDQFVIRYRAGEQNTLESIQAYPPINKELDKAPKNLEGFQEEWRSLKDTHDFFAMIHQHKVSRLFSMYSAPEGYVRKIKNEAVRVMLHAVAKNQVPIMAFVGNKGILQIHSGVVNKIVDARGWLNVLDPAFNLHLNERAFYKTFIVKKPAEGDYIHSMEVYDVEGNLIVQFFGARKPGLPELTSWRTILKQLN